MSGHRGPRLYCVRGTQKGSAAISWRNSWPWAPSPNAHTSARIRSPHPDPLWDTPKDTQKSPTGLCPVTLPSDARCSPDAYSHTIAALAFHPRHTIIRTHARTHSWSHIHSTGESTPGHAFGRVRWRTLPSEPHRRTQATSRCAAAPRLVACAIWLWTTPPTTHTHKPTLQLAQGIWQVTE